MTKSGLALIPDITASFSHVRYVPQAEMPLGQAARFVGSQPADRPGLFQSCCARQTKSLLLLVQDQFGTRRKARMCGKALSRLNRSVLRPGLSSTSTCNDHC